MIQHSERFNNRRLFSQFYDSVNQGRWSNGKPHEEQFQVGYTSRIRLDALLNRTIVLTDAQVLDGMYFLHKGPGGLSRVLWRVDNEEPVIEIRARSASLEDALIQLVRQDGQMTLRPFYFSSIPCAEEREQAMQYLQAQRLSEVTCWRDLPRLLRLAHVDKPIVDELEAHWAAWIERQAKGVARVIKWGEPANIVAALDAEELDAQSLRTEAARDFYERVLRPQRGYRGLVIKALEQFKREVNGEGFEDACDIERWYQRGYNRTLADQHQARLYTVDDAALAISGQQRMHDLSKESWDGVRSQLHMTSGPVCVVRSDTVQGGVLMPRLRSFGESTTIPPFYIVLPDDLVPNLAVIPDQDFSELVRRNWDHFDAWWQLGDEERLTKALRPFADRVVKEIPILPRWARLAFVLAVTSGPPLYALVTIGREGFGDGVDVGESALAVAVLGERGRKELASRRLVRHMVEYSRKGARYRSG